MEYLEIWKHNKFKSIKSIEGNVVEDSRLEDMIWISCLEFKQDPTNFVSKFKEFMDSVKQGK